ncbi:hypothetical protein HDV05_002471 [Chytridiales sp. JEL 0842]|nr:hypothetical protein HDV05_002471 [Chytridiales sp. JEL 0842]
MASTGLPSYLTAIPTIPSTSTPHPQPIPPRTNPQEPNQKPLGAATAASAATANMGPAETLAMVSSFRMSGSAAGGGSGLSSSTTPGSESAVSPSQQQHNPSKRHSGGGGGGHPPTSWGSPYTQNVLGSLTGLFHRSRTPPIPTSTPSSRPGSPSLLPSPPTPLRRPASPSTSPPAPGARWSTAGPAKNEETKQSIAAPPSFARMLSDLQQIQTQLQSKPPDPKKRETPSSSVAGTPVGGEAASSMYFAVSGNRSVGGLTDEESEEEGSLSEESEEEEGSSDEESEDEDEDFEEAERRRRDILDAYEGSFSQQGYESFRSKGGSLMDPTLLPPPPSGFSYSSSVLNQMKPNASNNKNHKTNEIYEYEFEEDDDALYFADGDQRRLAKGDQGFEGDDDDNININESEDVLDLEPEDPLFPARESHSNDQNQDVAGGMQDVTLEDVEDVDALLGLLDKYLRKSRYSKMVLEGVDPSKLPPVLSLKKGAEWQDLDKKQQQQKQHQHEPKDSVVGERRESQSAAVPMVAPRMQSLVMATDEDLDEAADEVPLATLKTLNRTRKKSEVPGLDPPPPFQDTHQQSTASTTAAATAQQPPPPPTTTTATTPPTIDEEKAKMDLILSKLSEANVKKITTRIYIQDARNFKTLVLTSLMTADQVIQMVVSRFKVEESEEWSLFELCNDLGIERPLRDWEVVTDVISAWDTVNSTNAIVMKKYGYRSTLVPKSISGRFPKVQGYLYTELKQGKWQKRFCALKESTLYYYTGPNYSGETVLLRLTNFDVYTLTTRKRRTPTNYCFALRSTQSVKIFEDKSDYMRFFCVDKQERLFDWVLAIRLAKNESTYIDFPEIFEDYPDIPARERAARIAAEEANQKPPESIPISNATLKKNAAPQPLIPSNSLLGNLIQQQQQHQHHQPKSSSVQPASAQTEIGGVAFLGGIAIPVGSHNTPHPTTSTTLGRRAATTTANAPAPLIDLHQQQQQQHPTSTLARRGAPPPPSPLNVPASGPLIDLQTTTTTNTLHPKDPHLPNPSPTHPTKPLLTFPDSRINYQTRGTDKPPTSPAEDDTPPPPPSTSRNNPPPPRTPKRHRPLTHEDLDRAWEAEQAETMRAMEEQRNVYLSLGSLSASVLETRGDVDKVQEARKERERLRRLEMGRRRGVGGEEEEDEEDEVPLGETISRSLGRGVWMGPPRAVGVGGVGGGEGIQYGMKKKKKKKKEEEEDGEEGKKTKRKTKKKSGEGGLVDVSDSTNCRQCGCSELKLAKQHTAGALCVNCYHSHK